MNGGVALRESILMAASRSRSVLVSWSKHHDQLRQLAYESWLCSVTVCGHRDAGEGRTRSVRAYAWTAIELCVL